MTPAGMMLTKKLATKIVAVHRRELMLIGAGHEHERRMPSAPKSGE